MKLSSLTPTDKIKLAAELDGLKPCECGSPTCFLDKFDEPFTLSYNSYDTIIPLIQKQEPSIRLAVESYLGKTFIKSWYDTTPSQLLDALLVATGKAEL